MKKKKSLAGQLLLYFCTLLAVFITISGIVIAKTMEGFLLQLLFFPITLFLVKSSFDQIFRKKPTAPNITMKRSKSFFLTSTIVFFLLMFIGIRSVARSQSIDEENITTIEVEKADNSTVVETIKNNESHILVIKADNPRAIINIRETPSEISPIINQARVGQEFEFLSTKDDWYEIKIDDEKTGWIKADSIKPKE